MSDLQVELEYKLLFAVIVAGKSALFAQNAMRHLATALTITPTNTPRLWLPALRRAAQSSALLDALKVARTGNYKRINAAFTAIARDRLNLRMCTADELEEIPGIGPKTSRFFLRWSGRRERVAVIDGHILRWLAEKGHDVPRATPQSRQQYRRVEQLFLDEADRLGEHPADLDQRLWLERNKSGVRS